MAAKQLGFWSSVALVAVGVGYVVALGVGIAIHGADEPIGDPVLAVMEVLTILAALPIVTLLAAVHERAAPARKAHGLAALAFGSLCAGITCTVHFVELTAVRQLGGGGIAWPSRPYAAELLAWDLFLGLALVLAAMALEGGGRERAARRAMLVCGILCLLGVAGPAVGSMRLQLVGVVGYAVVLPIAAVLLARVFGHGPAKGA